MFLLVKNLPSGETMAAEDFRSASLHLDFLAYPGQRPDRSYLTDGEQVSPLVVTHNGEGWDVELDLREDARPLDEYLRDKGVAPLSERIAVMAFGANMCPGSLKSKFAKAERQDMNIVPTIYGDLAGADIVWSGSPGLNGYGAVLYDGPEVSGTTVQVGANLLTPEQLLVMHATEINYQLARTTLQVENAELPVYYYAGQDSVTIKDGGPVAVAGIPVRNRVLREADNTSMTQALFDDPVTAEGLKTILPEGVDNAQDYVAYVKSLRMSPGNKTPRRDLKEKIIVMLSELGMIAVEEDAKTVHHDWMHPDRLAKFGQKVAECTQFTYRLPSEVLEVDTWPSVARRKVLDSLNTHFSRHAKLKILNNS